MRQRRRPPVANNRHINPLPVLFPIPKPNFLNFRSKKPVTAGLPAKPVEVGPPTVFSTTLGCCPLSIRTGWVILMRNMDWSAMGVMRSELVQPHHHNNNHCNQKASSASTMSLHAMDQVALH